MTAFSAASSQNLAARVCCVTSAEAELASAAEFGRSIGWIHKKVPLSGKTDEKNPYPCPCQGTITEILLLHFNFTCD